MGEHILVIGATLLDVKGKPTEGLEPGTSNPGRIRTTRGGTARNVAENLARLGADVVLVSAIGDDVIGRQLIGQTAEAGADIEHVQVVPEQHTGAYIAILELDGTLSVALDDTRVMEHVTGQYLYRRRRLFRDASFVMFDGSLSPETMETVIRLARQYDLPVAADPSSARLADRLCPHLKDLNLVVPNEVEAANLCSIEFAPGSDTDASLNAARQLVHAGVTIGVVTLSNFGLAYATSDENGYIPPRYSEMVDTTGTGDALTAAIIFGMINGLPTVECMRLGAAAAGLTLQTNNTVVPDLSLDMLYDHLIV
jgi:pseudouridine kinase